MSNNNLTLTAIVPFYNEEEFLRESVERLVSVKIVSKILLVDDFSSDDSFRIAKNLESEFQNIKVLQNQRNLGKGSAVKLAQNYLETTHLVIHDADLEYDPNDLVEMFETAKKNSKALIIGSRFIGNKLISTKYKRTYYANKIISKFFSFVFKTKLTDVATCYKLMSVDFFKKLDITDLGFSFEIEVIAKYLKSSNLIFEVPISYSGRTYEEGKKIKTIDGFVYILKILFYAFSNKHRKKNGGNF